MAIAKSRRSTKGLVNIGAYDLLHLPGETDRITISVKNAIKKEEMERKMRNLSHDGQD